MFAHVSYIFGTPAYPAVKQRRVAVVLCAFCSRIASRSRKAMHTNAEACITVTIFSCPDRKLASNSMLHPILWYPGF